jgi:ribonuclease E
VAEELPDSLFPSSAEEAPADPVPASVEPVADGETVAPVKRVRAPRKRTAPRAAPRTAVADELAVDGAPLTGAQAATLDTADALASIASTEGPGSASPATEPAAAAASAPADSSPLVVTGLDVAATELAETPGTAPEAVPVAAEAVEAEKKPARRRSRKATSPAFSTDTGQVAVSPQPEAGTAIPPVVKDGAADEAAVAVAPTRVPIMPLFQAPEPVAPRVRRAASRPAGPPKAPVAAEPEAPQPVDEPVATAPAEDDDLVDVTVEITAEVELPVAEAEELIEELAEDVAVDDGEGDSEDDEDDEEGTEQEGSTPRRRRRRGGRGRRGRGRTDAEVEAGTDGEDEAPAAAAVEDEPAPAAEADVEAAGADDEDGDEETAGESSGSRRRRRRRRRGTSGDGEAVVEESTRVVTRVRESSREDVTAIRGSTRLEAKKQRRREGREAGRRKSILTEAEFLTRRESVDRVMVVREMEGRTQIGVLEDGLLVEHYVARKTQTSTVGNVYLGRVQNVLPSMEAAFVDIGKGRNAVLYAGEVNWDAAGLDGGQPRRIEHALKAGEAVLVQVTKDPIGHKGARLTSQISMPGRYLVYVPDGSMTGISRKLPDTERSRLKKILREIVPDDAGVIVRTAAEGASDEELERDVARLRAQWEDISAKIKTVQAPAMLYGEPDLAIKVVRDIFNEDFGKLIVSGDEAWETLQGYVSHVAPDLESRLERWTSDTDVFAAHRIDEQLAKGLDRKVYLPSGGSLVIDRTEAMTVIDVNTGKFTGSGGNLEETVTKNNLEAAEEVVHQLRLRDIGGIIVVDFIDMVLESNRDLVLRRLLECLGRDRTRHQVAEVTSLGLVQMTRKRVGQGLIEVFSETCEHCGGRGLVMHDEPVEKKPEIMMGNGGGNGGPRKGRAHAH